MHEQGLMANGRLKGVAEWALRVCAPTLEQIVSEQGKRKGFAITVHDENDNEVASWEFNRGEAWGDYDFHMYAEGKARASVRTGLDSGDIAPQDFLPGEFPHPGAVVFPGYVVAGSGVEGQIDVICATIVGETIQAAFYGELFRITREHDGLLPGDPMRIGS